MIRRCKMCGAEIQAKDNRRKYCDTCRETRKHFFDAAALERHRQKARENRKAEKKLLRDTLEENDRLRSEIIRLRNELRKAVMM